MIIMTIITNTFLAPWMRRLAVTRQNTQRRVNITIIAIASDNHDDDHGDDYDDDYDYNYDDNDNDDGYASGLLSFYDPHIQSQGHHYNTHYYYYYFSTHIPSEGHLH